MPNLLLCLLLAAMMAPAQNLMPWPARIAHRDGRLELGTFRVALAGFRDTTLERAAARLVERLARRTGVPFPVGVAADASEATLVIECPQAGAAESYTLDVTPRQARIEAGAPAGALHGMETFLQLVEPGPGGFSIPAVRIEDSPRFGWRGLLIDASRHWMPAEVIKRNLDGMAAVKLNVLHWHLSDDQGFRVESKRYPRLQEMGSDGNYYTQAEVREIVAYARDRGIRVVPEFDMPGHTSAWFPGYPELAAFPGPYRIERGWGVIDACMDPTREEVYTFLDGFIGEMSELFPGEYFHIGGDEVNGKQWDASERIRAFKREHGMKSNDDLQAWFNQRLEKIVSSHGKKMVGWDEVAHPDLPKNVLVQSWRGQKALAELARQGYEGLLSFGYYLDLAQPASFHYANDPLGGPGASLSPAEQTRILGGEACLWAELVTPENVDGRIWPRLAAIAERLWSPVEVTDLSSMYRRMAVLSRNLDWLGLTHNRAYPTMLARIAGGHDPEPLRLLAGILEPVKNYTRHRGRAYRQDTPLNRLVDAVAPESLEARAFGEDAGAMLAGKPGIEKSVVARLRAWRDNDARLRAVLQDSFLGADVLPLSADVATLAAAGLDAIAYLASGKPAPAAWISQQKAVLKRAAAPRAELLIMIVPAIGSLVDRAAKPGGLRLEPTGAAPPATTPGRRRPPEGLRRH
jgi:hexosaminidase